MKTVLQRLLCLWVVLSLVMSVDAGTPLNETISDPASGIRIEASMVFDHAPQQGAVPMRIRIANDTGSDGVWRFQFSSEGREGLVTTSLFKVGAGQTRTFAIAPLKEQGFSAARMRISGPGVIHEQAVIPVFQSKGGSHRVPFLVMSNSLAKHSVALFRSYLKAKKEGMGFGVAGFDPTELPEHWRGLIGIEWLSMTEAEWAGISPEIRAAIRRWVAFGGELVIASPNPAASPWGSTFSLPNRQLSGAGPYPYGSGYFRAIRWDGSKMPMDALETLVQSRRFASQENASDDWAPFKRLNTLEPHRLFITLFVLAFAVVVGPINLFYFAPAGRRHRLFVTTPLLSLGGTFILLLAICVKDGTGGTGSRFTALQLLPGGHEMLVMQDQVVRTGLLLSSRFTLKEDASLRPVNVPDRPSLEYAIDGQTYSGQWFRSRSVQAQQLAAVRPTRATLTLVERTVSGVPVVVSGMENPIEELFFRDADGSLWRGAMLRKGERTNLTPVAGDGRAEWIRWWNVATIDAFPESQVARREARISLSKGHFSATLATPAGVPIETLDSIRWQDDRVVAFGPMENALPAISMEGDTR